MHNNRLSEVIDFTSNRERGNSIEEENHFTNYNTRFNAPIYCRNGECYFSYSIL